MGHWHGPRQRSACYCIGVICLFLSNLFPWLWSRKSNLPRSSVMPHYGYAIVNTKICPRSRSSLGMGVRIIYLRPHPSRVLSSIRIRFRDCTVLIDPESTCFTSSPYAANISGAGCRVPALSSFANVFLFVDIAQYRHSVLLCDCS
jgi:hypothetical protein